MRSNRSVYLYPSRFLLIFLDPPPPTADHPGVHVIARLVGVAMFDFSANRLIAISALGPVSVITTRILNPLNVDSSRLNFPRTREGMTSAVSILFNHMTMDLEASKEGLKDSKPHEVQYAVQSREIIAEPLDSSITTCRVWGREHKGIILGIKSASSVQ